MYFRLTRDHQMSILLLFLAFLRKASWIFDDVLKLFLGLPLSWCQHFLNCQQCSFDPNSTWHCVKQIDDKNKPNKILIQMTKIASMYNSTIQLCDDKFYFYQWRKGYKSTIMFIFSINSLSTKNIKYNK